MSKLYQCPYCKATKCDLKDPCLGCETFSEFLNAQRENSNISDNEKSQEFSDRLLNNQKDIDPEFNDIVNENLDKLI